MLTRLLSAALVLSALPLVAQADDDLDPATARDRLATGLSQYGQNIADMQKFGTTTPSAATANDPKDCFAVIDQYKKYLKADDKLRHWGQWSPDATVDPDNSNFYILPFSKAKDLCQAYSDLRATILAAAPLEEYFGKLADDKVRQDSYDALSWYSVIKDPGYLDTNHASQQADACGAAIDQAIAAGARPDVPVKFGRKTDLTLEDLRARCTGSASGGDAYVAKVKAWAQQKWDAVAKPLEAAGIKGDKLDLFIYYDGGWYLPGCTATADTPAQLKKAKKLFRWLTDSYGKITIQKFTFKGNGYKTSEKSYWKESKAYKGCK